MGRVLTLALDRPLLALAAAIVQAAVLLGLGLPLTHGLGARGVALALVGATLGHALVFLVGVARLTPLPWRQALTAVKPEELRSLWRALRHGG